MKSEILIAIAARFCGIYLAGLLRRTANNLTSARQWAVFLAGPMTSAGYAILAVMGTAIFLAAVLSTFWARVGLGSVFRVGCWFS